MTDKPTRPEYKGDSMYEYATAMTKYYDDLKYKVVPMSMPNPPVLTSPMSFEEVKEAIKLFKEESPKEKAKMKKKENIKQKKAPWDIKKDNSLLKTIIISATILLSVAMYSYSYYKSHQYSMNGGTIIDKYNGTWKSPNYKTMEVEEITYTK